MNKQQNFGLIVAGVGGQGAVTIAQLALGAAWMSGFNVLQSEVHGMSQRGGEVSAHIVFSSSKVTSPTIEEGSANLLIGLEPLESLRHLHYLKKGAPIVSSSSAIINMNNYPDHDLIISTLRSLEKVLIIDSDAISKDLGFSQGGNIALLGAASRLMPITKSIWEQAITERFKSKGEKIVAQNLSAFNFGLAKS